MKKIHQKEIQVYDFKRPIFFQEVEKNFFRDKLLELKTQINQNQLNQIQFSDFFIDDLIWEDYINAAPKPPFFLILNIEPFNGFSTLEISNTTEIQAIHSAFKSFLQIFFDLFALIMKPTLIMHFHIDRTSNTFDQNGIDSNESGILFHLNLYHKNSGEQAYMNLFIPYVGIKPYLNLFTSHKD